jgi:hypothetical protein
MLKHPITMSKGSKVRLSSPNYQKDCTQLVTENIDIEYEYKFDSDYKQY